MTDTQVKASPTQKKGFAAERMAAKYLQQNGLTIQQKNYRCKLGEIDIIAYDQNTLVFIEVRHRRHNRFGTAAETVTYKKQQKLIKTSQYYLQRHRLDLVCRFDVIESTIISDTYHFNWIKNAFDGF